MSAERENMKAAEAAVEREDGCDAAASEAAFVEPADAADAASVAPGAAGEGAAVSGAAADAVSAGEHAGADVADAGADGDGASASAGSDGAAAEDAPSEEELAAARELAEHNALADVFDDVRKQSADSHLVTPDRWPEIGLVPEHMTAEDFEMFVYEWLEDYLAEHKEEIEAERAAERAKAASVHSATRTGVGCPPKIPNRRLAQIEADEKAAQEKAAAQSEQAASAGATQQDETPVADASSAAVPSAVASASLSEPAGQGAASDNATQGAAPAAADKAAAGEGVTDADAAEASDSPASATAANDAAETSDDASPFAGLKIPEGYKLEQIEGEWVLVEDADAAPVRKEIKCDRIKVLMGMHSYYLYDETFMTDNYAHWAFLAAEDNPVVTFVDCVREDARIYPRPYPAECLKNPPFRMTDEQIEQTWQAVRDSGNYPDIERTQASNGDVYYYSTKYLSPEYAASLAEYDAVERPADV